MIVDLLAQLIGYGYIGLIVLFWVGVIGCMWADG